MSDDRLRALLDELLALADEHGRTVTGDPKIALCQAWFVRCVDTISAALHLHDHGRGEVAAPLVRAAIEHAIGVMWLQRLGDEAVEAVARSHQGWAKNVQKAIAAANTEEQRLGREDWSPALNKAFEELALRPVPEGATPGTWKIDQRFKVARQFDLLVAWLSETAASHATHASAAPYIVAKHGRYGLLRVPKGPESDLVLKCAAAALVAFRAVGEASASDVWTARVDRLDDQIAQVHAEGRSTGNPDRARTDDWARRHDR
jgi:hypothetical protein